jgi:hypothetical protein
MADNEAFDPLYAQREIVRVFDAALDRISTGRIATLRPYAPPPHNPQALNADVTFTDDHGNDWEVNYSIVSPGSKAREDEPASCPEVRITTVRFAGDYPIPFGALSSAMRSAMEDTAIDDAISRLHDHE